MLHNWLVTALRNFARHRLYSFINIAGLAVGLASVIFIALFLRDELSYDKWVPDSANVYRAEISLYFPGEPAIITSSSPFPLGPTMKAELPEVAAETHIVPQNSTMKVGDRQFPERVNAVDPDFFRIIRLPLSEGNAAEVFAQPESVVLSQTTAHKYFGDANPLGRTVTMDAKHPLTVTGVMCDLPHNTHLIGDVFIPNTSKADQLDQPARADWFSFEGYTYVKLAPGSDAARVQQKTRQIFARHIRPDQISSLHLRADQLVRANLAPFGDVHLTSDNKGGMKPAGSWTTIYGFAAIAALILAIACFNFMNLATARAMMRAREVSLRKVVGARRLQLVAQFLGESVLTALLALVLALAAVEILLPAFDRFLGRPISLDYMSGWPLTLGIVAVAVLAGMVGGFYPALVLSGFRPAAALTTNASGQGGSGLLRAILVVLQFAISIGLGVAALVVFAQIRYARDLDLGFERDNIVVIGGQSDPVMTPSAALSFLHTLDAGPGIVAAAQSSDVPFETNESRSNASVPGNPALLDVRTIDISPEFPAVYGMKLLAGRFLSRDRGSDVSATPNRQNDVAAGTNVLVDAMAARMFGFTPAGAVGKAIKIGDHRVTIVGVVRNALFHAARAEPISTLYYFNPSHLGGFSVRVKGGHIPEALAFIDGTWRRFAPSVAIRRHFLDDSFDKLFAADERQGEMFGIFVGIAIFIACLGLFGLAAFNAERRTKEIGMRKVFGARTRDVVRLLLWQFSIPVLIANAIAWPIAWYYLHNWLESYAYRIALSPLYFFAAGAAALVIAWATVIGHSLAVARANPVHALRYE
ncbi:MAG TPA: ABC transporter permease [Rhizomicrobium sp.]|jgi:putative ABC transport system permease protein|nr:ABC transporter permease [Rhizomicrobium sp.]